MATTFNKIQQGCNVSNTSLSTHYCSIEELLDNNFQYQILVDIANLLLKNTIKRLEVEGARVGSKAAWNECLVDIAKGKCTKLLC
jgi:hypothetical protein